MRSTLTVAAILALGAAYLACGPNNSPLTNFGDDAGSSGSGGSSGGGSGGSSGGSSGGTSSGSKDAGHSSSSGGSSGGTGSSSGAACTTNTGPISGTVGNTGGSVSRLVFAVVGDTRPANEDDTGGYPTSVISKIYSDIEAQSPRPVLALGTGDYQFSNASSGTGAQQVSMYMQSRATYSGPFFPAMGNHECGVSGGFTTSDNANCGPNNQGGATVNYNAFMSEMLTPIGQTTNPYYAINISAQDNSWTAKFVMTAANAWDSGQQTWLQNTLAQKTTYTFVVRHEPTDTTDPPPGVAGVDALLMQYPYTLLLVGHTHNYGHWTTYEGTPPCGTSCPPASKAVVIGNGGAPLSSTKYDYGYGLFSQRCDGAIVVDEYDYMSGATDSYFHFVVNPDGSATM